MTAPEAAALLRCSVATIDRLQAEGLISPRRLPGSGGRGQRRLFLREEVLALLTPPLSLPLEMGAAS
jgi:DNA-binding transcriptional MerR regulator